MGKKFTEFFNVSLKPDMNAFKEDYQNAKNKEFFTPCGTQIYTGLQGSGKTYSMVRTLIKIKKEYPKCIIVTNLNLNNIIFGEVKQFTDIDELGELLTNTNNGIHGVVYAIDEIQTFFNALDSKNIPMYIFTEISQQRKQRKLILGTSQLFLRVAKPFREQVDHLITCKCIGGKLVINEVYLGATIQEDLGDIYGKRVKFSMYFQTQKIRDCYDTYQKVTSGREEFEAYQLTAEYAKKQAQKRLLNNKKRIAKQ